jgi:hypothetical protein
MLASARGQGQQNPPEKAGKFSHLGSFSGREHFSLDMVSWAYGWFFCKGWTLAKLFILHSRPLGTTTSGDGFSVSWPPALTVGAPKSDHQAPAVAEAAGLV